jgi:cell wall-associated NlpC family hydrolase
MLSRLRRSLPAFALAASVAIAAVALVFVARPSGAEAGAQPRALDVPDVPTRPVAPPPEPPPSPGERAIRVALRAVGVPYRWGGESPESGFDCSGLVRWAYGHVGIDLPHSSYALYGEGRPVARRAMSTGDLLFFEGLGHVGLYVGRGRMVHAPQTGRTVEVVSLARTGYGSRLIGARRVARG